MGRWSLLKNIDHALSESLDDMNEVKMNVLK